MSDDRQTRILAALRDLFDAIAQEVRANPSFAGKIQASLANAAGLAKAAGASRSRRSNARLASPSRPTPGHAQSGRDERAPESSRFAAATAPVRARRLPGRKGRRKGKHASE